jgi:hypothetical protein
MLGRGLVTGQGRRDSLILSHAPLRVEESVPALGVPWRRTPGIDNDKM